MENSSEFLNNTENRQEIEPRLEEVRIFRVRHGDSVYDEHTKGRLNIDDENLDLTEKGLKDLQNAAQTIGENIDPNIDMVAVISSARRRAESGKEIVEEYLKRKFGENILIQVPLGGKNKDKDRSIQHRVDSMKMVDKEGNLVDTDDQRYPDMFNEFARILTEETKEAGMKQTAGFLAKSEGTGQSEAAKAFEPFSNVQERSRHQLSLLIRAANLIQPKIAEKFSKRLNIVQIEHNETLDELYEVASGGKISVKNDTGAEKGEVVMLTVPLKKYEEAGEAKDEIKVDFLNRKEEIPPSMIKFDRDKKQFIKGIGNL